ncbi:MAG: NADH-quinone oxidoreductase subunit J [Planctomycetes bacterium]|nr:NADH-quinone oxidoreductase subunit J [Planctomycetota bacterium]
MGPTVLYTASVFGAVAVYLLLRPGPVPIKVVGTLLGLGAGAWILKESAVVLSADEAGGAGTFFVLFSLIAIASAVRMITHHRPLYSALYFVMVVLSSAGLFLLLEAEFMAFALVIVYAGAILVTYLFVLMLAQQTPETDDQSGQPEYDRVPREPAAAVVVGFVLFALLGDMFFSPEGIADLPAPPSEQQARVAAWQQLDALPDRLASAVRREIGRSTDIEIVADRFGSAVRIEEGDAYVLVRTAESTEPQTVWLPDDAMPQNIEQVGLALIAKFPVSLELAGVILLMAMFGAVVLAQRQIELSEQEKRAAAAGDGHRRGGGISDAPPAAGTGGGGR